ncbi:uncharacterized protein LY89DRAFT_786621 [Mollisia scopiformis]|uniref:Uncharacterized protein n=1 Tax=Mollisia scopiformis TaxID=149040 RepID=A0A194WUV8_MOLSC|nr:uncharacterized protein LY89DRAFT_786621 [Mollisia scopiformis]KUJ11753.1 hypothetical protein LY89DRAFT_786621 [Mollisia scopiformis]
MNRNRSERAAPKPPPAFSFVTITNPNESKTRSRKRAVRSHVAYYQHHKDDDRDAPSTRRSSSKRVVVTTEEYPSTPTFSSESSSDSINFHVLQSGGLTGSELDVLGSTYGSSPATPTFSGTRVDPFESYPVPWKPHYGPILDFYLTHVLIDTPGLARKGEVFLLRTAWFPFIMNHPTTFYAALAFAASIYYKRSPATPNLLDLHQKAILGINDALSKMEHKPDDFTIGAVFCMSLLESMYGDASSYRVHMKGLQRMVEMRGGLGHLGLDGLLERMIVWLDFNHAKVHKTSLFFGESVDVSKRPSPFYHPKDSAVVDTGSTKILR